MNMGERMNINLLIGKKDEYDNPNAEIEENILKEYAKNFDVDFTIEHNCQDYTTLKYKEYDVVRLKYGQLSKWIKLFVQDKQKYMNDPLFETQQNKKELYWKSAINTIEDLDKYIEIIKERLEKIK
jgi:hypothetical protein